MTTTDDPDVRREAHQDHAPDRIWLRYDGVIVAGDYPRPWETNPYVRADLIPATVPLREALLPCPFCGGNAALVEGDETAYVQCLDMKMHRAMFVAGDNAAGLDAATEWNRRTAVPQPAPVGRVALVYDDSLSSQIGELGNQIHNLGCEYQNDEKLSERLGELRSTAWGLARRAGLAAAQQPAPMDRKALVAVIREAGNRWNGDDPADYWRTIAAALIAAGLRLPGGVSHETAVRETQAALPTTDETQAPAETLAWAVVSEDGTLVETSINRSRAEAEGELKWGGARIVRVAIRRVEDEA